MVDESHTVRTLARGHRTAPGIVEESPERARELAALYHTPIFPDLTAALQRVPGLKGVWISTPTPSHVGAIEQVVAAGLAVGIEKPVADSEKKIEHCYALAHKAGVPLYCSFQRRIDPSYQRLLAAVRTFVWLIWTYIMNIYSSSTPPFLFF